MSARKITSVLLCLLGGAFAASKPASAVTFSVQVITAGSSAQYGVFAEAAYQLAKAQGASGSYKHYTVKGGIKSCGSTTNGGCAFIHDTRNASILDEPGNAWVVWSETSGNVWVYLSIDSIVGVRSFSAYPRTTLNFVPQASLPASGSNALAVWDDGSSDSALDAAVYAAINGKALTAANTDVRPEDALGATARALAALNTTNYDGLGYDSTTGNCGISFPYQSLVSPESANGPIANAVSFAFSGADPCSGQTIPTANAFKSIPIGAAPVVFLVNKTNTAAGHLGSSSVTNITVSGTNNVANAFECNASGHGSCNASYVGGTATFPMTVIEREPISGTYNTMEFSNVRLKATPTLSQETGVNGTSGIYNPLDLTGTLGVRERGVGTGDVVKGLEATADSLGYIFFSYEAANTKTGGNAVNLKYLKLDGIDPLATSASSTYTGAIPACGSGTSFSCPITVTLSGPDGTVTNASFFELRAGNYRSWSEYRMISDSNGNNFTNAQTLVNKANLVAFSILPDFVPFIAQCSTSTSSPSTKDDEGLSVYREHFTSWTDGRVVATSANDGSHPANVTCTSGGSSRTLISRTLGGGTEVGGDVGGTIVYTAAGQVPVASTGGHQ